MPGLLGSGRSTVWSSCGIPGSSVGTLLPDVQRLRRHVLCVCMCPSSRRNLVTMCSTYSPAEVCHAAGTAGGQSVFFLLYRDRCVIVSLIIEVVACSCGRAACGGCMRALVRCPSHQPGLLGATDRPAVLSLLTCQAQSGPLRFFVDNVMNSLRVWSFDQHVVGPLTMALSHILMRWLAGHCQAPVISFVVKSLQLKGRTSIPVYRAFGCTAW